VPFNSSCYSPIVVHHNEDLISSPILPLTPASLSPPTTDVAILAQISPIVSDVATDSQSQRTHSMITRSLNNIYKPKQFHVVTKHPLPHAIEPSCVSQALGDPRWRQAMFAELTTLIRHGIWTLISPPKHCHPINYKWVFQVKRNADGTIDRFKARLVAKGFNQHPGLDYKETFSPVVKLATIQSVLTIVLTQGWQLRQLDVNNAFLHGLLNEDVYMVQPPGFKDDTNPQHVCRLNKAIYGLKQAPRAWYSTLRGAILEFGFVNSRADSSLFIYKTKSVTFWCMWMIWLLQEMIPSLSHPSLTN
jgi:hypothetical protein